MIRFFVATLGGFCLLQGCQAQVPTETQNTTNQVVTTEKDSLELPQEGLVVKEDSLIWGLQALLLAYPEHLSRVDSGFLVWKDGTRMPYDDGKKGKDFLALLNEADLEDQMAQAYPLDSNYLPLPRNLDPGRIRFEPFFLKMYGKNAQEVRGKLRSIVWMPKTFNVPLQVTTVNGIDRKLEAISAILDEKKHLHPYLKNPGGTFNWRKIAGTERLSTHSFGMTLDINVAYSDYWRWNVKQASEDSPTPIVYKNRIPLELVEIFEAHGFIWGGKWYHYDTMHFEYRPELLQKPRN